MKPPISDLYRRKPVWEALSELFLDTELDDDDHKRIATVLARSGYTVEEMETILRREVGPAVSGNLLSTAGVWDGFDGDYLEAAILHRENSWWRWFPMFTGYRMVQEHWKAILDLLPDQRGG